MKTTNAFKSSILKNLRDAMKNKSYVPEVLQAYIIPAEDPHQSEYIADAYKRRAYVTCFTGSYGIAVVTHTEAALWTDGRYFLQAEQQMCSDWTLMKLGVSGTPTESEWLSKVLPAGSKIGVDPSIMSFGTWSTWHEKLHMYNLTLIPVEQNLVDIIWTDRPSLPNKPIVPLDVKYTGKSLKDKVEMIHNDMKSKNATALVLTALDDTAWLFNLRGADIPYDPLFYAYSAVTTNSVHLFVHQPEKVTPTKHKEWFGEYKVDVHSYSGIKDFIVDYCKSDKGKIWINKNSSYALVSLVPKDKLVSDLSPVALRKAIKNDTEIKCMRHSHVKDAVALCEFFCWLEKNVKSSKITEMEAADVLDKLRTKQEDHMGPSFATISAAGPNAAMAHYKATTETNRIIDPNEFYLNDSGGQYRDGTTDVTRTWHYGTPSDFEKECYTRVLKGHIKLSSAVFPEFVVGQVLDSFARESLWEVGLDYMHGTGHGVGMYLNVHEGPMGISWRPHPGDPGLQQGMVLSIEPGYYEDNKFGIRIENLAVIVEAKTKHTFKKKKFLRFDALTLVPIQTDLLVPSLLAASEIQWLNDYHAKCREVVGSILKKDGKLEACDWLLKKTVPLG